MHVLIAEDDPKLARFIANGLASEGHQTTTVANGEAALEQAQAGGFDLLILDLGLPRMDGLEVLRRLRQSDPILRVIVVTARAEVDDRVIGLDLGADDYISKPFSFVELSARIRALFRRSEVSQSRHLTLGDLCHDRVAMTASRRSDPERSVELSRRESQLLEHFLRHPDEPQTRPMIFDRVWGYQFDTGTNLVDVYINYLRKKLRELGLDPIETLRGVGYVLDRKHCEGTR